jgi:hypothetical protein
MDARTRHQSDGSLLLLPFSNIGGGDLVVDDRTQIRASIGFDDDPVPVTDEEGGVGTVVDISSTRLESDNVKWSIGLQGDKGNTLSKIGEGELRE